MMYVERACCSSSGGHRYVLPDIGPTELSDQPVIATNVAYQPTRRVALHEGAHAVTAHALGVRIDEVRVAAPPLCSPAPGQELDHGQRIALCFAGPLGEGVDMRWFGSLDQRVEDEYLARARDCSFGRCDFCQVAANALVAARHDVEAARRFMRNIELRLIDLFRDHKTRNAIRALADALEQTHIIDGTAAHALIGKYIEFGAWRSRFQEESIAQQDS